MRFVIGYLVLRIATSTAEAAEELDFARVLKTTLEDVILPAHQAFADAYLELKDPVNILCDYPSREHLEAVRISFENLDLHWSKKLKCIVLVQPLRLIELKSFSIGQTPEVVFFAKFEKDLIRKIQRY